MGGVARRSKDNVTAPTGWPSAANASLVPGRQFGLITGMAQKESTIDPQARIGHVHLKVADLERSLAFWHGVLGFTVTQRMGRQAAFLAAGGYHHHIGLNTWESAGGTPPPPRTTGLFHVAILYPTRTALAEALLRCWRRGSNWRAPPTTGSARRSICAIRIRTAWN